ncbi:MAG: hypothetical protein HY791_36325 [Deltaproteobacteria bacterium]|nr:hypothetical protein [Deltaproteobacteria bacterium]
MSSRIEATFADPNAELLSALARELRLSKSQVLEEAVALFQKVVLETRRGHRLAFIDSDRKAVLEFATPTLVRLESAGTVDWGATERPQLTLAAAAADTVDRLNAAPPEPSPALRGALKRRRGR